MKNMLIDVNPKNEVRVAIINDNELIDYESENFKNERVKGNIYLAKIIRVEPSLQAAFVDYGAKKHGFLSYNEIHPDYFKIPTSDKKKLLEQEFKDSQSLIVSEDEENENLLEENFSDTNTDSKSSNLENSDHKGFLSKIFDFFNYKPLEDYNQIKVKRKKNFKAVKKDKPVIFHRKYSIQEVIKSNQVILIQVVKEERGNKGAAVTTRLSLAGKYCVLMPNTNKGGGISRKIIDLKLRKKLKDILSKLKIENGMGVIIRTAGESMGLKEIKRDYGSLIKLWKEITSKTIQSNAPCLIHEEDNLIKRSLRDYFDSTFNSVFVNNKEILIKCKQIVKQFMPQFVKQLKLYKDKKPLFFNYGIESKIIDINNPTVKLKSGGYLVINQTEALVAIDINSGKFTKNRNIEDTAFQTNLEAAEEISRQIRIRDLAGLIVIDFIDMLDRNHNFKVEKRLRDFLKYDRARVQVSRISNFGLMELSRQRLKVNEESKISVRCSHCHGYGRTLSSDFFIEQMLRAYTEITYNKPKEKIFLICNKILKQKIEENLILNKQNHKFFNIASYEDLKNQEFIFYKRNTVIFTNTDSEVDIEKLNQIISFSKKSEGDYKNKKGLENTKKNNVVDLPNSKSKKDEKIRRNQDPIKRKSYRQKVQDLHEEKPRKHKSENQIVNSNTKNIKVINKHENDEKRQGWWNQ